MVCEFVGVLVGVACVCVCVAASRVGGVQVPKLGRVAVHGAVHSLQRQKHRLRGAHHWSARECERAADRVHVHVRPGRQRGVPGNVRAAERRVSVPHWAPRDVGQGRRDVQLRVLRVQRVLWVPDRSGADVHGVCGRVRVDGGRGPLHAVRGWELQPGGRAVGQPPAVHTLQRVHCVLCGHGPVHGCVLRGVRGGGQLGRVRGDAAIVGGGCHGGASEHARVGAVGGGGRDGSCARRGLRLAVLQECQHRVIAEQQVQLVLWYTEPAGAYRA